jgi:hypothetical protein
VGSTGKTSPSRKLWEHRSGLRTQGKRMNSVRKSMVVLWKVGLTVAEYMFVYKYAERTNRKGSEPWTIRQSAFYHRIGISDKRSLYIAINPYQNTEAEEMIRRWLQGIPSVADYHQQVLQPATMLLSLRLDQWRQYMKHYEREVTQVVMYHAEKATLGVILTSG